MRDAFLRFLVLVALTALTLAAASCSDDKNGPHPDPDYPTIVHRLDQDSLAQLSAQTAATNPHVCFRLNDYGYTTGAPINCISSGVGIGAAADSAELIFMAREMLIRSSATFLYLGGSYRGEHGGSSNVSSDLNLSIRRRRQPARLDFAPFVSLALILMAFNALLAKIGEPRAIEVGRPPSGGPRDVILASEALELSVRSNSGKEVWVTWNRVGDQPRPAVLSQLKSDLARAQEELRVSTIVLSIDRDVTYATFVSVVDALRDSRVSFVIKFGDSLGCTRRLIVF